MAPIRDPPDFVHAPTSPSSEPTPVRETARGTPAALVHTDLCESFPWLVQGTTTPGGRDGFDLGLFGPEAPLDRVYDNWAELATSTGFETVVHARQVHGADIRVASGALVAERRLAAAKDSRRDTLQPTLLPPADGHVTDQPGVLLAVTTADCVPVFLIDPGRRAVGAVHAGWRGVAAGVLERAFDTMRDAFATIPSELRVHLGPAICGECYEVGPEVFEALGEPRPATNRPIDVRRVLADRARRAGVPAGSVTVSEHCTRCTGSGLYSHRAGHSQRQVGYIGIREWGSP